MRVRRAPQLASEAPPPARTGGTCVASAPRCPGAAERPACARWLVSRFAATMTACRTTRHTCRHSVCLAAAASHVARGSGTLDPSPPPATPTHFRARHTCCPHRAEMTHSRRRRLVCRGRLDARDLGGCCCSGTPNALRASSRPAAATGVRDVDHRPRRATENDVVRPRQ